MSKISVGKRHVGKRPAALGSRKDQLPTFDLHALEDIDGCVGKWSAMLPPAFHSARRNCPDPSLKADLVCGRQAHFAGPRGGQDQEFQRALADALTLAQVSNERW